jgi:hypothetical protein
MLNGITGDIATQSGVQISAICNLTKNGSFGINYSLGAVSPGLPSSFWRAR